MMVKVNEDLQRERNKCDFDVEELTNFIDGGVDKTAKRRELGKYDFILVNIEHKEENSILLLNKSKNVNTFY